MRRTHDRVVSALEDAFRVSIRDIRLATTMMGYQLLVVSTFITGRTVRDTLFLRRADVTDLPAMYIASATTVALTGFLYSRVADRYRRDRSSMAMLLLAAALMSGIWCWIRYAPEVTWTYPLLYVLVEVLGSVCIIQFWTTANDIFTSQQSKRLFGFIGAGGVIANIFCGVSVGGLSWVLGPVNLLLLNAALFVIAAVLVRQVGAIAKTALEDAVIRPRRGMPSSRRSLGHRPLLRAIGVSVAVTFLVVTLVDFQFKIAAREAFPREAALASFFGYFYGITGVVAGLVQVFLTSRILTQAGVLAGLAVLPGAILSGAFAYLLIPGMLIGASIMRAAENAFRYTIHDATLHLLYVPIPGHQRGRAKAFIDGVIKPASIGTCGLVLLLLTNHLSPVVVAQSAVWVDIALVVAWLMVIVRIRRGYVRSLGHSLESRRLEPDDTRELVDDDTRRVLTRALGSSSPHEVLHVLELVGELEISMTPVLVRLAQHPMAEVRAKALALLEPAQSLEAKPVAMRLIEDRDAEVRAAAVRTLCAIDRDGTQTATRLLDDPSRRVRAAAVIAIARYGDFETILTAGRTLDALLHSTDEKDRQAGVLVISEVQWADFFRTMLRLMNDPSVSVRRSAIGAAGKMGGEDVLLPLVHQLADDDVATAAIQALISVGTTARPLLLKVLQQSQEDLRIRRRVPRVLAVWGEREAYDALVSTLSTRDPELRTACARAAGRIRERHPSYPLDARVWTETLEGELKGIARDKKRAHHVRNMEASLLADALEERAERRLERVGDLLVLRHPGHSIRAAFTGLSSVEPRIRSQAWELLENVLDRGHYLALLTLLEAHHERSAEPKPLVETRDLGRLDDEIRQLAREAAGWVAAVAVAWVGDHGGPEDAPFLEMRASAPDPLVRESALFALHSMTQRFSAGPCSTRFGLKTVQKAAHDRSERVSRAAGWILERMDLLSQTG
ncbi:MAG: Npt1/Npt2 family nucleotide transporter [Myxococcota bacterium]